MRRSRIKKTAVTMLAAILMAGLLAGIPVSRLMARESRNGQGEQDAGQVFLISDGNGYTLTEGQKQLLEKMKEKMDAGELESEEDIRDAIAQCEEELQMSLTEEQKEQLVGIVKKLNDLGLSSDEILSKAQELYEEYGEQIKKSADAAIQENVVEPVKEAVVEGTKSAIREFFQDMGNSIRNFFTRLFS